MTRNRFDKVSEPQGSAVTLTLRLENGKPVGEIAGPVLSGGRKLQRKISLGARPAEEALNAAVELANDHQVRMVVVDPEGAWQPECGTLT